MAMTSKDLNSQDTYFKFLIVALLFLLLAFDRDMAMIYLLILFGDWVWSRLDRDGISFPISRPGSQASVYVEMLAGLGIFLFVSTALVTVFSPQSLIQGGVLGGAQSIFHLLATSTPILQGSRFLTLMGWGVLIPIIETSFFNGRLLEGLTSYAEEVIGKKISFDKFSTPLVVVIMVVASLFTLFHITAKGISSVPLLITFIFSIISSILVIRQKSLKGAILLHIITNSMAVISLWGLF